MSRGKPRRFTKAEVAIIEKLASVGMTRANTASFFGISHQYFDQLIVKQASVKQALEKGRAKGIAKIAQSLFQKAVGGDVACMIFYLKTQAGWSETREEISESETYKAPLSLVREN